MSEKDLAEASVKLNLFYGENLHTDVTINTNSEVGGLIGDSSSGLIEKSSSSN